MFYRLLFAHLVADFVLQNTWMVKHKWRWPVLGLHTGIVWVCLVLVIGDAVYIWWPWLLGITAAHGLIDWAKLHLDHRWRQPPIVSFLADQVAHLLIILLAALWAVGPSGLLDTNGSQWGLASLYLICTFAASIALPLWLNPPSVMQRPYLSRLVTVLAAAAVLTCTWRGYYLAIPIAVGCFYALASQYREKNYPLRTLRTEILAASAISILAGWFMHAAGKKEKNSWKLLVKPIPNHFPAWSASPLYGWGRSFRFWPAP
jgi:hypothetical protein